MHGSETGWMCDNCGERFLTEDGMKSHKLDVCFKFCCNDCGKMFKRASLLEKHRVIHTEKALNYEYHCDQCGKDFNTPEALKRHAVLHLNLRQFECFCGKAFNRKDNLRTHQKTHTTKESPQPSIPGNHSEDKSVLQASIQGFSARDAWQRQQEQQHVNWLQWGVRPGET